MAGLREQFGSREDPESVPLRGDAPGDLASVVVQDEYQIVILSDVMPGYLNRIL